jgi:ABC-type phosphate transport system permease subunit
MEVEVKQERRKRRKKRKKDRMIFYVKAVFFAIMIVILIWCIYALIFESKVMKDRRDTGQIILKYDTKDFPFQAKTTL